MAKQASSQNQGVQEQLLAEYHANVELWKHDDSLRQDRQRNFLTVTTVLLATLAALAGLRVPVVYAAGIASFFALYGILICRVWHAVQIRNAEYVRFRRFQLWSIEARLPDLTTFTNTYAAFYENKDVSFAGLNDRFALHSQARNRSTLNEGKLPLLVGLLWAAIGATGLAILIIDWGFGT